MLCLRAEFMGAIEQIEVCNEQGQNEKFLPIEGTAGTICNYERRFFILLFFFFPFVILKQ